MTPEHVGMTREQGCALVEGLKEPGYVAQTLGFDASGSLMIRTYPVGKSYTDKDTVYHIARDGSISTRTVRG